MSVLPRNVLGLDIGSHSIKWMLYEDGKECTLYDWDILKLPSGMAERGRIIDVEGVARSVKEILKTLKGNVKKASVSFACPEMIIRTVYLPRLKLKELQNAVAYEMEYLLPTDAGDYIFDYKISGEEPREGVSRMKVLIAAFPAATVAGYIELLNRVGLRPLMFDFHGSSVSKVIYKAGNVQKRESRMLVDIGASLLTITVMENGAPIFTRSVQKARGCSTGVTSKLTDAFSVEQLLNEVRRSADFFESRNNRKIDAVITAGGGCNLRDYGSSLADGLGLKVITIDEALLPLIKERISLGDARAFINVLGLALTGKYNRAKDMNLLPEKYKDINRKNKVRRIKVTAGLCIGVSAIGAVAFPIYYRDSLRKMDGELEREMSRWNTRMEYVETQDGLGDLLKERKETVDMLLSQGVKWSALFRDIGKNTPLGIRLISMNYSDGETLILKGTAADYNTVARFVVMLQNIKGAKAVHPVSINTDERRIINFEVWCFFEEVKHD